MLLWNGACMVHEIFSLEKITKLKVRHPNAKLIAHPECEDPVLRIADYIGSTTGLIEIHTDRSCTGIYRGYRNRHPSPDDESNRRIKHLFLLLPIIAAPAMIARI